MKADACGGVTAAMDLVPSPPSDPTPTLYAGTQGDLRILMGAEHLQLPLALGYQAV